MSIRLEIFERGALRDFIARINFFSLGRDTLTRVHNNIYIMWYYTDHNHDV